MTTIETVTEAQINSLCDEAAAAGDMAQVELCNLALSDLERPWEGTENLAACVETIRNAEAQQ